MSILKTQAQMQIVKSSDQAKALASYILNDYRSGSFSTSWTSYAINQSDEESLIQELLSELTGESEPQVDYLEELPTVLLHLACAHAKSDDDREKFASFSADAIRDLTLCHLREMTNDELDVAA